MKDFYGQTVKKGDSAVVVYQPEAYKFTLEKGVIIGFSEQYALLKLDNGKECKTQRNEDRYPKLVKIKKADRRKEDLHKDAVGQTIRIGDKVAFQLPKELPNTCKGFEYGGVVTKLTASFVFAKEKDGAEEKRKKYNGVIVM